MRQVRTLRRQFVDEARYSYKRMRVVGVGCAPQVCAHDGAVSVGVERAPQACAHDGGVSVAREADVWRGIILK